MVAYIIIACCLALLFLLFRKKKGTSEVVPPSKTKLTLSNDVMGKTTVVLRQMQTNADTRGQISKPVENPDTFAQTNGNEVQENVPMSVDIPTEYEEPDTEEADEVDESEEEEIHCYVGENAGSASGASFEDMEHSYDVIRERKTSEEDERRVAETIRRESGTDIFQQMVAQVPQGVERVSSLLDKLFSEQSNDEKPSNDSNTDDFDIAQFLS